MGRFLTIEIGVEKNENIPEEMKTFCYSGELNQALKLHPGVRTLQLSEILNRLIPWETNKKKNRKNQ